MQPDRDGRGDESLPSTAQDDGKLHVFMGSVWHGLRTTTARPSAQHSKTVAGFDFTLNVNDLH